MRSKDCDSPKAAESLQVLVTGHQEVCVAGYSGRNHQVVFKVLANAAIGRGGNDNGCGGSKQA